MGANELGTCHHNAERALVHPGARVPMQQESEGRGGDGGDGGVGRGTVHAAYCARSLAH